MRVTLSRSKLQSDILKRVEELSEQDVMACYQCGNCSAGCPAAGAMDVLPQRVMRLIQLGAIEELLVKKSIWVCASCVTCSVRCPRGVDIAKVMEALRQMVLRKKANYVNINAIDEKLREELPPVALIPNFRKFTL